MTLSAEKLSRIEKEADKRGFYLVGDKKYYSKFQAIVAASKTHFFPTFNFNDDIFSAADWKNEPVESLNDLYRQRAQQLRNTYDHLVLCYSSGSDSTNILHAFLDNNIPIDEIFMYGPFSSNQGKIGEITNSATYMIREIDLLAIPYLRELSKKHKFNITMYDWTDDLINGIKSADWIWTDANCRLTPSTMVRNRLHESRSHLSLVDSGKKVGFIYGVDKPKILIKDNNYYVGFLDLLLQGAVSTANAATGNEWDYDEYFYWTPDFPKLIIKQAHILKNFLEKNPTFKSYVEGSHLKTYKMGREWEKIMKQLLYPNVNFNVWQADKNKTMVFAEPEEWFYSQVDLDARKHWIAGLKEIERIVDPSWFNSGTESIEQGFVGSWSKWHKIG